MRKNKPIGKAIFLVIEYAVTVGLSVLCAKQNLLARKVGYVYKVVIYTVLLPSCGSPSNCMLKMVKSHKKCDAFERGWDLKNISLSERSKQRLRCFYTHICSGCIENTV